MKTAFRVKKHALFLIAAWLLTSVLNFSSAQPLVIGSKRFTESYILSEIFSQKLINSGVNGVVQKSGLGNTGILLSALKAGEIDLYPEYTGTISREILKSNQVLSIEEINKQLQPMGLAAGIELGFSNSYALAMKEELANQLGIQTISDLKKHPELVLGLSHEFIARDDGWRGLSKHYQLKSLRPRGLDHGIAYEAIAKDQINVIDAYTTDSKIIQYGLKILIDDKSFFPSYDALILYKINVPERFPEAWRALSQLEHQITQKSMLELNALAELKGQSFKDVAHYFLDQGKKHNSLSSGQDNPPERPALSGRKILADTFQNNFFQLLMQHLYLVLISLTLAIMVGIPLGVLCFYRPQIGQALLLVVSALQTIPSLALLAFLISILGTIGTVPAIGSLFVYGVLPIIQNTHTGMGEIPKSMRQAACALGLRPFDQLSLIELPLALPVIMSGIKVSAVLTVGNATLAAFVGAGGFGERIAQGLALNDTSMLLAGAIPSALLALLIQMIFTHLEKIPRNHTHG